MLKTICSSKIGGLLTGTVAVALGSFFLASPSYADEKSESKPDKTFTECAAVRMKEVNLGHLEKDDISKYVTQVPEGWTVVSGAGGEGHPKLLICR